MLGKDKKLAVAIVMNGGIVKLHDQNGNRLNRFYFSGTISVNIADPHHVTVITSNRTMAVCECMGSGTKMVSTPFLPTSHRGRPSSAPRCARRKRNRLG